MSDSTLITFGAAGDRIGIGCEPGEVQHSIKVSSDWTVDTPYSVNFTGLMPEATYGLSSFGQKTYSATWAFSKAVTYKTTSTATTNKTTTMTSNIKYCELAGLHMVYGPFHRYEIPVTARRYQPWLEWGVPELYSTMYGFQTFNETNLRALADWEDDGSVGNVVFIRQPFNIELPLFSVCPELADFDELRHPVITNCYNTNFDFDTGVIAAAGELTYAMPSYGSVHSIFTGNTAFNDIADQMGDRFCGSYPIGDVQLYYKSSSIYKRISTIEVPNAEFAMTTYAPAKTIWPVYPWNATDLLALIDEGNLTYGSFYYAGPYTPEAYTQALATIPIVIDGYKYD